MTLRKRKPRGSIPRAVFGYHGMRAGHGCEFRYTVSGTLSFPRDMLRYDGAALLSPSEAEGRGRREVRIVHASGCTPERWRSFGWTVHDDIEETAAAACYTCEVCGAVHRNEFSLTCRACDTARESADTGEPA